MNKHISLALFVLAVMSASGNAVAQSSSSPPATSTTTNASCGQAGGTCSEDFTGTSASLQWTPLNDACLTAGDGTGSIPKCGSSVAGYAVPSDETTKGQGALLLTPPVGSQTGAILSKFPPFPLSQGINITFTTYTFGGSRDGPAKDGADGITFFMTDGTQNAPTTTGGSGGSMGYDCSNVNGKYDGVAYGYLGLGIDEWGNFLNSGDNGSQGVQATNQNSYGSGQYQSERIGLRGSGNTNWASLTGTNASTDYPGIDTTFYSGSSSVTYYSGVQCTKYNSGPYGPLNPQVCQAWGGTGATNKVQQVCRSGKYVTAHTTTTSHGITYLTPTAYSPIAYNYNPLSGGFSVLPNNQPIANDGTKAYDTSVTRYQTSSTSSLAWPITYQLKISASGQLSFSYSYNGGTMTPVLTNFDVTSSNGPLPAKLRFGFSAGTGGSDNFHEITCFKASPLTSTSSAAANTIQSGQYKTGTQIYLASYSASPWWGSLKAIPLVVDSNGDLAASNTATWDGKCTLTSGFCDSLGTDTNSNPVYEVEATAGTSTTGCSSSSPCIKGGFVNPEARVMVTATGANVTTASASTPGVGFSMQQALTSYPNAVQTAFASAATTDSTSSITMSGSDVLNWLLGQRCKEQLFSSTQSSNGPGEYYADCSNTTATGNLTPRTYVLGDIIDSSPLWVGAPVAGQYNDTFTDDLYGSATQPENQSTSTYSQFVSSNATRLNMVYVGSNDGYLHGFEAGYFDTTSNSVTCGSSATASTSSFSDPCGAGIGKNDGAEKVAYMPYDVLLNQAGNLTNPLGSHQYLVDATPGAGDLFYGNAWHTWLVGGVGVNGKEIYALDVTNPGLGTSSGNFSNAKALVMGDWDNNNAALSHLGNTVGTPSIVRMHNGQWAIIFGNGLNSGTSAGVYIGLVDKVTGAVTTFLFLDTGVGGASGTSTANGIAYVTPVDLDGDGIMDYLYAGDQLGNVWRFDVTSNNSTQWSVSNYPGSTASTCSNSSNTNANGQVITTCSPLFTATTTTTGNGTTTTNAQPITTGIVTATIQTNGVSRDMVYFGTGEKTPQTGSGAAQYAPASTGSSATTQQQTFYGIWDWNMGIQASSSSNGSGWNSLSSVQFASLTGMGNQTITTANLSPITSTDTTVAGDSQIAAYRTLSGASTICWASSASCSPASNNTQYGWYYNLPGTNEQIIYSPTIIQGEVVVNTAIPPGTSTTQCTASNQSGWTMAFDATSGNALTTSFFSSVNSAASGVQASAVGTPTAITYNGQVYLVSQTVTGGAFIKRVTPRNNSGPARVSWREIRN